MLNELSITNFAIIDELHVSFDEGMNIISGETGAGKSILIGAVSLLLGDRAAADMIRTQADTATVEALFNIRGNKTLEEKLLQMGFPAGDELIIRRVISRAGKNRAQINGQMATLANLASVTESLIHICGQHEHQVILGAENHIDILDEFGGNLDARADYRTDYDCYQQLLGRIGDLENMRRHRAEKSDLIQFQLSEIEKVDPHEGEDVTLAHEKKVLASAQKLSEWANRAYALLYSDQGCINDKLKDVLTQIKEIQKIDPGLKITASDVEGSFAVLQEAALALRDYTQHLVFDPERLNEIDERLDAINRLKRKHGGTLDAVLAGKRRMVEDLLAVSNLDGELERLDREKENLTICLRRKAMALSSHRLRTAARLKKAVDDQIHDLNMPHASFFAEFLRRSSETDESFGPKGGDDVEFYLAANVGDAPKPLNKIASGGELSRIVLALKNVLSQTGSVGTAVFDEVDSGIGGATAEIVGRKLKEVSANHQVICITHLPQIASFGGLHLRVTKKVVQGRTSTEVEKLDDEQKIEEISRMLGGVDQTQTARDHARAMLAAAKTNVKTSDSGRSKHAEKSTHR
jgi:DNA repair protein RecN (Recombination protein N)